MLRRQLRKRLHAIFGIDKRDILTAFLAIVAFFAFVPVFTYAYFAKDITTKDAIMDKTKTGIILYDRKDRPFFKFYDAPYRSYTPLKEISPFLIQAVISAEDREFYSHPGFSIKAIAGAIIADVKKQDLAYGASTITQQLVKISLLSRDRNFLRKYQEIILAQELERRYSKDEILEMYLNAVYFGHGAFGAETASKIYFDKSAKDLTLEEASMLAGIISAPTQLDPISGDFQKAKDRQAYVLTQMEENKVIRKEEKANALKAELSLQTDENSGFPYKAPHFALMVRDQLIAEYGEEKVIRSGYHVKTTIDLDWQAYAEDVVRDQVGKLAKNNVSNGAAVVMDPKTGEIRALVGSKDWNDKKYGKLNITTATRQPGSSFKPLVYLTALKKGTINTTSTLHDSPTAFPGGSEKNAPAYSPQNYDRKFRGNVTLRRALANSLNVPAVETLYKTGIEDTIKMAENLGITTLDEPYYGLSMALGTGQIKLLELTNVYAILANYGKKNEVATILEIKDKGGKLIYTFEPKLKEVVEAKYTFIISSILSDNNARAEMFGNVLNVSRTAAVKTGTTDDYKDSLTIGYTPNLVVGVWVGNNNGEPMDRIAGSIGAAPIWRALIEKFSENTPLAKFEPPAGVIAMASCGGGMEYYLEGTQQNRIPCPTPESTPSATIANTDEEKKKETERKRQEEQNTIEVRVEEGKPPSSPQPSPSP